MFLPAIVPQSNRTSHLFWSSIWNFSSSLVLNGSRWEDNFKLALHIWHFVVFGDVLQLGRPKYRVDDDCKKAKVQMRGVVWNRVILDSHSWPETVKEVKWYLEDGQDKRNSVSDFATFATKLQGNTIQR